MNKIKARVRRSLKTRAIIRLSNRPRLTVHRSASHIYAQIIIRENGTERVLVASSTLDKELKTTLSGDKSDSARKVGELLASRAKANKITEVAFDRAGFKYHGRVKQLAEGAREGGLIF